MRQIVFTSQYKRDLKLALRRNLPEEKLNEVIKLLATDQPLPAANKDHALKGEFRGFRECHIQPNWLLMYRKDDLMLQLVLMRTGTHADLFGM
ncbi:MAG: type II toxin-antitoxin system YafQ family toxin [Bacteroidales bacterium]|nr:type II toxin-antitoxin system YafQ family toxin [Bacteroidales bacterium]